MASALSSPLNSKKSNINKMKIEKGEQKSLIGLYKLKHSDLKMRSEKKEDEEFEQDEITMGQKNRSNMVDECFFKEQLKEKGIINEKHDEKDEERIKEKYNIKEYSEEDEELGEEEEEDDSEDSEDEIQIEEFEEENSDDSDDSDDSDEEEDSEDSDYIEESSMMIMNTDSIINNCIKSVKNSHQQQINSPNSNKKYYIDTTNHHHSYFYHSRSQQQPKQYHIYADNSLRMELIEILTVMKNNEREKTTIEDVYVHEIIL